MTILSQDFVFVAIESEKTGNTFPIDFDDVWETIGYSRKDAAKRALVNSRLKLDVDYHLHRSVEMVKREQGGGVQPEKIYLTIDGFKQFCMLADTEQGAEVRRYFIDVEKTYRTQLEATFNAQISGQDTTLSELEAHIERLESKIDLLESGQVANWIIPDHLKGVWYPVERLQDVVRYSDISNCVRQVKKQGVKNVDWRSTWTMPDPHSLRTVTVYWVKINLFVTMILSCRTERGLYLNALPEELDFVKVAVNSLEEATYGRYNNLKPKQ